MKTLLAVLALYIQVSTLHPDQESVFYFPKAIVCIEVQPATALYTLLRTEPEAVKRVLLFMDGISDNTHPPTCEEREVWLAFGILTDVREGLTNGLPAKRYFFTGYDLKLRRAVYVIGEDKLKHERVAKAPVPSGPFLFMGYR